MGSSTTRALVIAIGVAATLLASGCECGPSARGLAVDLRTNLVPGVEFDTARTQIFATDGRAPLVSEELPLSFGAPVADAVRIAEADLPAGSYAVRVALLRAGNERARRTLLVTLDEYKLVTALVTRSCLSVLCPEESTCLDGQCVPQDCIDGSGFDGCPPLECTDDDTCTTEVACAVAECAEGTCQSFPRHTECASDEYCQPERGCFTLPWLAPDGGTDDGGTPPSCSAGGCDDGNPCTDDACEAGSCRFVPNAAECDDGVFCNGGDRCEGGACALHDGDPCPGASTCDEAAETCTGCAGDGDCPAELATPSGDCAFAGACADTGSQPLEIRSFTCESGSCVSVVRTGSQSCSRPSRDGVTCGPGTEVCSGGACVCPGGGVEASGALCRNGTDDDCDGDVDCADADCAGVSCGGAGLVCVGGSCACPGGSEGGAGCSDGMDNDCDGSTDCADSDCAGASCGSNGRVCSSGACRCPGGGTESSSAQCRDGSDNDCDGAVDCADSNCNGVSCGPNGRVCSGGSCVCPGGAENNNVRCGDGIDNDCDGDVDCADSGCEARICDFGSAYCGSPRQCRRCEGGACVVNTPHYDPSCNPSCGEAGRLCGGPAECCDTTGSCPSVGPGPYADCVQCCAATFCY